MGKSWPSLGAGLSVALELERLAQRALSRSTWPGPVDGPRFPFFGSRARSRTVRGQGVQDVDRPAEIQPLPEPVRARRPRVESESLGVVPRAQGLDRIGGQRDRWRDVGQGAAVRPLEPERAVGLSIEVKALFVDRAVVPATEPGEVRERGRAALRPVPDVMPLAQREPAAREAAAVVPVVQRAPQRRGNRPGPGADLDDVAVWIVLHHHPAGVARQAPRRFL